MGAAQSLRLGAARGIAGRLGYFAQTDDRHACRP
jgi:hypothetical protein